MLDRFIYRFGNGLFACHGSNGVFVFADSDDDDLNLGGEFTDFGEHGAFHPVVFFEETGFSDRLSYEFVVPFHVGVKVADLAEGFAELGHGDSDFSKSGLGFVQLLRFRGF